MSLIATATYKMAKALFAYVVEVIRGNPEISQLARRNKAVIVLVCILLVQGVVTFWIYTRLTIVLQAKADIAHTLAMVQSEALNDSKSLSETLTTLRIDESRVRRLEQLYDGAVSHGVALQQDKDRLMQDAINAEEARALLERQLTDAKDDLVNLTKVRDKVVRDRVLEELKRINEGDHHRR